MAVNRTLQVLKCAGPTLLCNAEDRTTSGETYTMKPGEPVRKGGTGGNFVQLLDTGSPQIGSEEFAGIVRKESTETSTADGTVEVTLVVPGTVLRGYAETYTNMYTAATLLGLINDSVCLDVTALTGTNGDFEIDENEGDDPNVHGLIIIGGDINKYTLDVLVNPLVTLICGGLVGQTMD